VSRIPRIPLLMAPALAAGMLAVLPQQSASAAPTARYIAYTSCKAKGRWGKAYIKTDIKPSGKKFATAVEWGYAIQRTTGNHKNTNVTSYRMVKEPTGKERWSGGLGYTGYKAIEDNKWHKGPRWQYGYLGHSTMGQQYLGFTFDFDKGTGGSCTARVYGHQLKRM
jgi:hypothetical protein